MRFTPVVLGPALHAGGAWCLVGAGSGSLLEAGPGRDLLCIACCRCSSRHIIVSAGAGCRYLIAAGDPLQLPPVVVSPAHVTAPAPARARTQQQQQQAGAPGQLHGLLRPLFVRLAALGLPPFLLRRQYR